MAPRPGLDRSAVLTAASDIADEEGLAALSLARIAERLNVRSPSLYRYVASLEDAQHGVAVEGARGLAAHLSRAAIGKNGPEGVRAVAAAYRAFARAHPGRYTALQRAPAPDDRDLIAASADILQVLGAVLAPWRLDGPTLVHALRTFRSLAHGFVALEAAGGFGIPVDLDESFDYALNLFIDGLNRQSAARAG